MGAARKSDAVRKTEEAVRLAELNVRIAHADADIAEARKRMRHADVQRHLAWPIILKTLFFGPGLMAIVTTLFAAMKK